MKQAFALVLIVIAGCNDAEVRRTSNKLDRLQCDVEALVAQSKGTKVEWCEAANVELTPEQKQQCQSVVNLPPKEDITGLVYSVNASEGTIGYWSKDGCSGGAHVGCTIKLRRLDRHRIEVGDRVEVDKCTKAIRVLARIDDKRYRVVREDLPDLGQGQAQFPNINVP